MTLKYMTSVRVKLKCAHIQIRNRIEPVESLMFWLRKNKDPSHSPNPTVAELDAFDVVIVAPEFGFRFLTIVVFVSLVVLVAEVR